MIYNNNDADKNMCVVVARNNNVREKSTVTTRIDEGQAQIQLEYSLLLL